MKNDNGTCYRCEKPAIEHIGCWAQGGADCPPSHYLCEIHVAFAAGWDEAAWEQHLVTCTDPDEEHGPGGWCADETPYRPYTSSRYVPEGR